MGSTKRPKKTEEHALREWVSDNLRYILLIAVIVVIAVVILLAVRAFSGSREETADPSAETRTAEVSSETESAAASESAELETTPSAAPTQKPKTSVTAEPSQAPSPTAEATPSPAAEAPEAGGVTAETQLSVSDVVARYFEGLGAGDVQQVESVVEILDEEDRQAIAGRSFAENYGNFRFLTYPADTEGAYVVFAAYEYQYPGFSTRLPALTELYVYTRSDGSMCIASEATENEKAAVLQQALENEEVQALLAETRQKYEEVLLSDPELNAYVQAQ